MQSQEKDAVVFFQNMEIVFKDSDDVENSPQLEWFTNHRSCSAEFESQTQ